MVLTILGVTKEGVSSPYKIMYSAVYVDDATHSLFVFFLILYEVFLSSLNSTKSTVSTMSGEKKKRL